MARELPEAQRPLPVLKVLYRNTNRIQERGGREQRGAAPGRSRAAAGRPAPAARRSATPSARKDMDAAERTFAALRRGAAGRGLQRRCCYAVQDDTEVHRVVLPYRAWDLLDLIGQEHAHTLLRQSVRYCVKSERDWQHTPESDRPRTLLPKLLDQYKLLGQAAGHADGATTPGSSG